MKAFNTLLNKRMDLYTIPFKDENMKFLPNSFRDARLNRIFINRIIDAISKKSLINSQRKQMKKIEIINEIYAEQIASMVNKFCKLVEKFMSRTEDFSKLDDDAFNQIIDEKDQSESNI